MRCPSLRILCLRRILLIAGVLTLVLASTGARAQDASTSAIRGVVFDSRGATVQGATVTIVNLGTGVRYAATTNTGGGYFLDLLPPGDYSS